MNYVNGTLLKATIAYKGLTHQDLANSIGVAPATLSNIIHKKSKPSYDVMLLLHKRLKLTDKELAKIFFTANKPYAKSVISPEEIAA